MAFGDEMKRYLISFAYDATNYHGYQKQPNLITVQETIEKALTKINGGNKVVIHAASRTDKGVHAKNQKAHFDLSINVSCYKLKRAINSNLSNDIHINDVNEVDDNFHARYLSIKKEYCYILNMGEYNPTERNYVYQYNKELDINKIKVATNYFIGKHDFTSFVSAEETKEDKVREIYEASIKVEGQKLYFTFLGNGFLKYQIRNMVGTLIEVGNGKRNPEDIKRIIEAKDRTKAGKTAKPEGLYLMNVWYE